MATPKRKNLSVQYVRGFPFPQFEVFKKEILESAMDYVARDDDIIISNYPKTGTNFVKYIVWEILNKGAPLPSVIEMHFQLAPYLEATGAAVAETLPPPRIIQFHLPYHLIPKNCLAKYIYVIRNPKDTLISQYHFVKVSYKEDVSFDDFFDFFLEGKVPFGDLFDHILSWYDHRDDLNILFVSYENLKMNPREEIMKIAEFLGQNYLDMLKEDEEMLMRIIQNTSFDFMKKSLSVVRDLPKAKEVDGTEKSVNITLDTANSIKFFRKGLVGEGEKQFSPEQNERFEEKMEQKMKGSDVSKFWTFQRSAQTF